MLDYFIIFDYLFCVYVCGASQGYDILFYIYLFDNLEFILVHDTQRIKIQCFCI